MKIKRVVITGVGICCPGSDSTDDYLKTLQQELVHVCRLPNNFTKSPTSISAVIGNLKSRYSSRHIALAREAVEQALKQSELDCLEHEVGLIIGTALGPASEIEAEFVRNSQSKKAKHFDDAADEIAREFNLRGASFTVTTGCTAGIDAIGLGFDEIRTGGTKRMVVGGTESPISPIVIAAFDKIGALSKSNEVSSSRPFDQHRDGFVLSEGACFFVLEDLESALLRGKIPIAEIISWESINNCYHMTNMRTNGDDLELLILKVLKKAGLNIKAVDIIDSHGTSTVINDLSEATAFTNLCITLTEKPFLTAQKSNVGHSLGASSAIEIAGIIKMMENSFISKICNLKNPLADIDTKFITKVFLEKEIKFALKIASSFSGIHSAMLIKKY